MSSGSTGTGIFGQTGSSATSHTTGFLQTGGIFSSLTTGGVMFGQTTPAMTGSSSFSASGFTGSSFGTSGNFAGTGTGFGSSGSLYGSGPGFSGFGQTSGPFAPASAQTPPSGFGVPPSSSTTTNPPFGTVSSSTFSFSAPQPQQSATPSIFSQSSQNIGGVSSSFGQTTSSQNFAFSTGAALSGFGTTSVQQSAPSIFASMPSSTGQFLSAPVAPPTTFGLESGTTTFDLGTGTTTSLSSFSASSGSGFFNIASQAASSGPRLAFGSTLSGSGFGTESSAPIAQQKTAPTIPQATTTSSFFFDTTPSAGGAVAIGGSRFVPGDVSTEPSAPPLDFSGSSLPALHQSSPAVESSTAPATTAVTNRSSFSLFQPSTAPKTQQSTNQLLQRVAEMPLPQTPATTVPVSSPSQPSPAAPQPRSFEIQPETTTAATNVEISTAPASTPTVRFLTPSSSAAASSTPMTSTPVTAVTQTAASTSQDTSASGNVEIGEMLQQAIPRATQMENDFHFIAERLAERDVAIVQRQQLLDELIVAFNGLMSRQHYCERELQQLETQCQHIQQHIRTLSERISGYAHYTTGTFPLKELFDSAYNGLISMDAFFSEMETNLDEIYSRLEVEQILLELRDMEERRKKLDAFLNGLQNICPHIKQSLSSTKS